MEHTTNYGLNKPSNTEKLVGAYNALNENFDTLDAKLNEINTTCVNQNNIKSFILKYYYPIGSVYFSATNVTPSELFGGTWEKIENELVGTGLVGDTPVAEGNNNVTLSSQNLPVHTHTVTPSGGISEEGAHKHSNNAAHTFHAHPRIQVYTEDTDRLKAYSGCEEAVKTYSSIPQLYYREGNTQQTTNTNNRIKVTQKDTSEDGAHTHVFTGIEEDVDPSGLLPRDVQPIDILPTYLTVAAWRRTA